MTRDRLRDAGVEGMLVGGAAVGLHVTDGGAAPPRFTYDVDMVVPIESRVEFDQLSERLRSAGHTQPMGEDLPLCRWTIDGITVDVMPPLDSILGFTNSWYRSALLHAIQIEIEPGEKVLIIDVPHLLASKLEAFLHRGAADPLLSTDLTDIFVLLDGRTELIEEVKNAPDGLRRFIAERMAGLKGPELTELISGHLPGDNQSQARVGLIVDRIRLLAYL